jgi:16S rRNA (guanine527-N7)-methyltransferase
VVHADGARRSALDHLAETARVLTGHRIGLRARDRFSRYLDLLELWNRSQNLTGLQRTSEIVRGLFEDSLLFLPLLPNRPVRVVDLGAGAGIPGIPLRIIDEGIDLTLVESRRKRVSFLKAVRRELGFGRGVAVEEGRAEILVRDIIERDGMFDVAVARALGNLKTVVPMALSYLKPDGIFIVAAPPPNRVAGLVGDPHGDWQVQNYPELGVARAFFVARRSA